MAELDKEELIVCEKSYVTALIMDSLPVSTFYDRLFTCLLPFNRMHSPGDFDGQFFPPFYSPFEMAHKAQCLHWPVSTSPNRNCDPYSQHTSDWGCYVQMVSSIMHEIIPYGPGMQ